MISRRELLQYARDSAAWVGASALLPGLARAGEAAFWGPPSALPAGAVSDAALEAIPGKKPLVRHSYRPPNYETPVRYFNQLYTPNDAFFVRWHISNIPQISAAEWRLRIGGEGAQRPIELTLNELKSGFKHAEIAAVCQCSGNRRGLMDPHVPGVQWGYGAMGNARWKGVRLRDVLNKAGVSKDAVELVSNGSDAAVVDKTPDFVKSVPIWKALEDSPLIAWEMNGGPLPHWNGFPVRLVFPGWTATYWTKQVSSLEIVTKPFAGFWVTKAYRIPTGKFPVEKPFESQQNEQTTPITEMVVNSLITNIEEGQRFAAGKAIEVKGIAWDGGHGIKLVEVSTDGGQNWRAAKLGTDAGRFSFRPWSFQFKAPPGAHPIMARATNAKGQTQASQLIWNPAGYHHNLIERINIQVA